MLMLLPSPEQIVQTLHVFIALTILFGLRLLRLRILSCCLLAMLFAFVKEFAWDIYIEEDTWLGSLWDFFWYTLGTFLGVSAMTLHHRYANKRYNAERKDKNN